MKAQFICSIRTRLEEQTSKHLVRINNELFVFTFDNNNIIKSIYNDNEYFFY